MRAPSASTGENNALSPGAAGGEAAGCAGAAALSRSRRDSALAQPEERAADFAAQRAARPRFHCGEHRRRLHARDRAERARDRARAHAGRGAQLAQARERLGGRRGRVEPGRAQLFILMFDVSVRDHLISLTMRIRGGGTS